MSLKLSAHSDFYPGSCVSLPFQHCKERNHIEICFSLSSWNVTVLFYCSFLSALTFRQHLRGNTGIWTKDVTEADFTAVGANSIPQIIYDNKTVYPNQYPPAGTPVVAQQTADYYYTQGGVPYKAGSP
jgi:hypothetical protein